MEEEKPKVIIIGGGSIGANIAKNFGVTDMQVYRNLETSETTFNPPLNTMYTIEYMDSEYKSGRENRRQRRKEQRKKK